MDRRLAGAIARSVHTGRSMKDHAGMVEAAACSERGVHPRKRHLRFQHLPAHAASASRALSARGAVETTGRRAVPPSHSNTHEPASVSHLRQVSRDRLAGCGRRWHHIGWLRPLGRSGRTASGLHAAPLGTVPSVWDARRDLKLRFRSQKPRVLRGRADSKVDRRGH